MVRLLAMPLMLGAVASLAAGLAFQNSPTFAAGALIVGYVLVLAGIMLFRISRSVSIAANRPWFFAWCVFAYQVLLVATSIALLVFDVKNVTTWFIAYGLTQSLPFVCLIILSRRGKGAVDAGSGTDRATKKLGMRLLPSVIGEMALLRADRLLIPVFASYHQLGIYVVASTMAELAIWPLVQYIDSYTPRWAAQFVDGTLSPLRLFLRTCVFSLCVSASVAMPVYFAIPLLFGSAFDESASLIPILSAATAFFGISRVAIALATVANIAFWPTFINGAGVVSSLGFCALLIPHYGALGAAYACLISYGICAGFALVAVMRLSKSIKATTLRSATEPSEA